MNLTSTDIMWLHGDNLDLVDFVVRMSSWFAASIMGRSVLCCCLILLDPHLICKCSIWHTSCFKTRSYVHVKSSYHRTPVAVSLHPASLLNFLSSPPSNAASDFKHPHWFFRTAVWQLKGKTAIVQFEERTKNQNPERNTGQFAREMENSHLRLAWLV